MALNNKRRAEKAERQKQNAANPMKQQGQQRITARRERQREAAETLRRLTRNG